MAYTSAAGRAPVVIPHRQRNVASVSLAAIALTIAQAWIDPSGTNVYCAALCATATAITVLYTVRRPLLNRFPFSTLAVLGFCVTTYSLPLVAQTLNGKPLIFNLISPKAAFNATIAFQAVILVAHVTYTHSRTCRASSQWIAQRVLRPLWIFRVPKAAELWLLGVMGLAATWISRILYVNEVHYGDVGGKFLQALVPFIVAPLLIPLRGAFAGRPLRGSPFTLPALGVYFLVVVATAIAFNARAIFAVVLFTEILAVGLLLAMGRIKLSRRSWIALAVALLLAAPVATAGQHLATAMQIARGMRGSADPGVIATETLRALKDPEELERWRKAELAKTVASGYSGYSEIYLDSEFLQRLTYTKYTDLTVTASLQLAEYQRNNIRDLSVKQIVSILPTPLIKALGFHLDKSDIGFSTGDVYAEYAFNEQPGGQRSGSTITNTMDILGPMWPPVVFLIYVVIFMLLDTYSLSNNGTPVLSAIGFILLYDIFARALIYDSFRNLIDVMTRTYLQSLVVYTVLAFSARMACTILPGPRGFAAVPANWNAAGYRP